MAVSILTPKIVFNSVSSDDYQPSQSEYSEYEAVQLLVVQSNVVKRDQKRMKK